jgi:Abnormal spindle-like microcephaly-assoc'd, ASPM-SPD-2-Hydin/Beta-propeller repeat
MPLHPRVTLRVFFCLTICLGSIPSPVAAQDVKAKLGSLPLAFEPNQGQAPASYKFLTRRNGMSTFFRNDGMDIVLSGRNSSAAFVHLRWLGADPLAPLSGDQSLPGHSSYLRGSDPSGWLRDVPQFAGVRYQHLYPGTDLLFHGYENSLEHDFLLAPGADPSRIAFSFDKPARVTSSGDLIVDLGNAQLHFLRPAAYQELGTSRKEVPAKFLIARNGEIRFKLGAYDRTKPLVIDPVFGFSTYLDGTNSDTITSVTADSTGNVYVTGFTGSTDFPITNAKTPLCTLCSEANLTSEGFISKLDPTGHLLLYSTYLGGSTLGGGFGTFPSSIALDTTGNIYVAGVSSSWDFPHVGAVLPLTPAFVNGNYYFAASLKPDGSALNYSGLVGGEQGSYTNGSNGKMAVDGAGNLYLVGTTYDSNFQLTPGTLDPNPTSYANDTMFVLMLDPTGKLVYSTLVPGNSPRVAGTAYANNFVAGGISVDANGQVTAVGLAGLGLPTTSGTLESTIPHPSNAIDPTAGFVLQLNASASALKFATYLPGADTAGGLAVDRTGNLYIAGSTTQTNLPVSSNAYQKTLSPGQPCACNAGYILKLASNASSVLAGTYLSGTFDPGNAGTSFTAIALDSNSNVVVGGMTASADFPVKNPLVSTLQTSTTEWGLVTAEMSSDLSALLFSSFLSGAEPQGGSSFTHLAIDANNNLIIVGTTLINDFPTTSNSYQPTPPPAANPLTGYIHSFVAKLDLATPAPSVCLAPPSLNFGAVLVGTSSTVNLNITNCGNAALQISSAVSSVPSIVVGPGCPSVAAGATCALPVTFTPVDNSFVSGSLTLTGNSAIPQQTISIAGKGGTPQVFIPPSFQVADLFLGTQVESYIPFINTGDGSWIVSSVTATGDFTVDNRCSAPGANNTCFIGVIFTPTQPGLRTGTMTIADNQAGSPHIVTLSGNSFTSYPTPSISAIMSVPTDASTPTLQIRGTNFFPGSQVLVNGSSRSAKYVDEADLTAALTPGDIAQAGELSVSVSNPAPGGGSSNSFTATIYAAIRNITFRHTVYDPNSGHLFSTVDPASTNYAGQVLVIDPATAKVLSAWTVGGGPNQLAISDDGQFLYVGLDGDKKVAQVALPAGTVNFAVGLGLDPSFQNPMVADAIRVLPAHPHSWAVTLCGVGFIPCGEGVAVFDDSVERSTTALQNQLQSDALLFIGQDATTLYGTTFNQIPSTFYKFAISSTGISLSQSVTNFSGPSPGGGPLDSDGTSIYVSNGQILDPTTLAIKSASFPVPFFLPALKVDVPASRVYFSGYPGYFPQGVFPGAEIAAFNLASQQPSGSILTNEYMPGSDELYRWGTNGLVISSQPAILLFRTSLTNATVAPSQFFVTGLSPLNVPAGNPDLAITISGNGFAAANTVSANGVPLLIANSTSTQIIATIPAALLSTEGDVLVSVTDTNNHTVYLELVVSGQNTGVALSTNVLNFPQQVVGSASKSQSVTFSNTGTTPLVVSGVTATGDFSQTNNCTTVGPGAGCSITVVFNPSAAGNRQGFLQISDNDPTKTQSVVLSGIGADLQIGTAGNSGATASVPAGQSASYNLTISPLGGFTGAVNFSCSNLPQYAACSFNPSSANVGSASISVAVTISTSQQSAALIPDRVWQTKAELCFAIFLLFPFALRRRGWKDYFRNSSVRLRIIALVFLPLAGCAGGGSSPAAPAPLVTPAGTYTVNFVVSNAQFSRSLPLTLIVK